MRCQAVVASGLLLACVLVVAPRARADVVGPPPASCPPGSEGAVCHGLEFCRPLPCTADTDCRDGKVCREVGLCLTSRSCGGRRPPDAAPPPPTSVAERACGASESCGADACAFARYCAAPAPLATSDSGGCGCRAAAASTPARAVLGICGVAAALAGLLARRRR